MTLTTRATEEEDVVEDVIEDDDDDVLAAIDRRATTTATATTTSSNSARRRAPRGASECATPAKKMAALRAWLDGRGASRALCASGPPGCGKATAIKCVAEEAGYEVREWQAPTPTLWREYSHAKVDGDLGVEYSSKVDDFVAYVERATKYAPLSFLSSKTSRAGGNGFGGERVVLMIRDFPTSDENGRARILEAMRHLSTTPNAPPCAVVLTEDEDGGGAGNARSSGRGEIFARDVRQVMERAGATCINFNPVTTAALTKVLTRVCESEGYDVPASQIDAIVQESHGDMRSALCALDFWCLGQPKVRASIGTKKAKAPKRKRGEPKVAPSEEALARARMSCRDQGLGLFHALGKFLYNKRETTDLVEVAGFETMDDSFRRPPMRYDPEDVLGRSGIGAETATGFLFENFPDFIDSRCIDWAAAGIRYLSEAAVLARAGFGGSRGGVHRGFRENDVDDRDGVVDPNMLGEYVAGSVAARGVLFASKRSAAGFLPMRGPSASKVERAALSNQEEVRAVVAAAHAGDFSVGGTTKAATLETLPALRRIAETPMGASLVPFLPMKWRKPGEDDSQFTARVSSIPTEASAPRPNVLAAGVAHVVDRAAAAAEPADEPLTLDALDELDDLEDDIEDFDD